MPKYYKLNFDKPKFNNLISLLTANLKDKEREKNLK